ncbi:inner centromere protein [Emericellopsis atlantica]|uniref:Inner centromere protein n=1 Tax=Emericellopsis atlantica TaxID=2614577 RepID=A0A9P8CY96_9HYPO|nr:inner centromere protein [Emericellopsis atlantica]KAG9259276.1 inner centromere protein [Emericellopsis atlantica]
MAMRGPRLQVGSTAWVAEERSCAKQIVESEVEEFSFSARNELDWLNEHMAGIFDENQLNIAETFKTPGKLRGKTPRTARKPIASEARQPLSDVFASTPNGSTNRFAQELSRMQSPKTTAAIESASPSPVKAVVAKDPIAKPTGGPSQDSGYFGSQATYVGSFAGDDELAATQFSSPELPGSTGVHSVRQSNGPIVIHNNLPTQPTDAAGDAQSAGAAADAVAREPSSRHAVAMVESGDARGPAEDVAPDAPSVPESTSSPQFPTKEPSEHGEEEIDSPFASDDAQSKSDASSPLQPVVRKSSIHFASLPAREPMTGGKATGARTSRLSHLDHNRRSHFGRQADDKTAGHHTQSGTEEVGDHREPMEIDDQGSADKPSTVLNHNKTYTQRLQDQINRLGKSQPRPSKSVHSVQVPDVTGPPPVEGPKSPSPKTKEPATTTPGAFPEDEDEEEDDWVSQPPPTAAAVAEQTQSPRPALPKSHTADVMEGIHDADYVGGAMLAPSTTEQEERAVSPQRKPATGLGHGKSASVSVAPMIAPDIAEQTLPLTKATSISNASIMDPSGSKSPAKTPSRGFRDSPLKQVKNKLSSILKSSRGLLASSAALSAESKTSMLSPSTTRLAAHAGASASTLSLASKNQGDSEDVGKGAPVARRTRASTEREKEEKRVEKETKRMEEQELKLEKAREKERVKARVFSKEQERVISMEQQKEQQLPPPTAAKESSKATRSSPRKAQRPVEMSDLPDDHDIDMADAAPAAPPASSTKTAAPSQIARKEIKRPTKPTRDAQPKPKQAPTVIRVNTGSQQPLYQATAQSSIAVPETPVTTQLGSKASKASLQRQTSVQNLKGASSAPRPKALDLAAKKKEQDEREAQRRREAKAEVERKRAIALEEQRKQEQRRQEAERQKQKSREQAAAHAEAKQSAHRQAMIEKAKQTRAPPPAVRSQPNGPPSHGHLSQDRSVVAGQPSRPPSRMGSEIGRPMSTAPAAKPGLKRTMGPNDDAQNQARRPPSRGGQSYQMKEAKRRRTSQDHDELDNEPLPNIRGPPVRPSAGLKMDMSKKSAFQTSYTSNQSGPARDLFKATVTSQHHGQAKLAHPRDMAQISKGAIPFAPNANPAGPSHKTPSHASGSYIAKSGVKPAQKSSPRFQNGEAIELPEINTDDEDESEDEARNTMMADWADSPNLRGALLRQETVDPSQIFGPPAPLNMEEVFNKSKDRWHKFRARTSSANWSGLDRLTEDDIRKDLAARDKIRRDGGWSYELSKDVV